MPTETLVALDPPPAKAAPQLTPGAKLRRWIELFLVLTIAFSQSIYTAIISFLHPAESIIPPGYQAQWNVPLFQEILCLIPLAYVLYRRRVRLSNLGLRWSIRDLITGIPLALLGYAACFCADRIIYVIRWYIFASKAHDPTDLQLLGRTSLAALPFFLLNPFFEELIVRFYLMTELRELTGSWIPSVIASVLIQSSYHLYYGWQTTIAMGFQFLILAIYYARTKRATPVLIAHYIFDLYGFFQLW